MRIAVVGSGGQLAAGVIHECAGAHDVVAFTRAELDVTDDRAVAAAILQKRPRSQMSMAPKITRSRR